MQNKARSSRAAINSTPCRRKALLIFPDIPFPARRNGLSIRYAPIIEAIRETHDVHLVIVGDGDLSEHDKEMIREAGCTFDSFRRNHRRPPMLRKIGARLRSLLPTGTPFPVYLYDEREIEAFLKTVSRGVIYDVLLVVTTKLARVARRAVAHRRFVVDAVDSGAVFLTRIVNGSPLQRYDAVRVKHWERALGNEADYLSFVSAYDKRFVFGSSADENRIGVVPNGIFVDDRSEEENNLDSTVVGFLGNMAYPPNIKAALRVANACRAVRQQVPKMSLHIIGRSPTAEIAVLHGHDGVIVTGTVENIWEHIQRVSVFCFPMEQGAGQQNKLLEAMVAGVPVISSSVGNSGIGGIHGEHLLIAETDAELEAALTSLLLDGELRARLGQAGKEFVIARFSWGASIRTIRDKYLGLRADEIPEPFKS